MRIALVCTINSAKLPLFSALRGEHYRFLIAQRPRIVFGGPLRISPGDPPETMLIVVEVASLEEARAFIAAEPYSAHGGFSDIRMRFWSQVIPESEPGALEKTLNSETHHAGIENR